MDPDGQSELTSSCNSSQVMAIGAMTFPRDQSVKTHYCLQQQWSDDIVFEVEVIDPKDKQEDVEKEDNDVKAEGLNGGGQTREQSEDCLLNFAGLIY